MKYTKKKLASSIMAAVMASTMFTACDKADKKKNRKETETTTVETYKLPNLTRKAVKVDDEINSRSVNGYTNFSIELLKNSYEGTNTMISPLSVVGALGMTMNGADNNTLVQMEEMFGMSLEEVNTLMYLYNDVYSSDEICQANKIFLNSLNEYELKEEFRQNIIDYYNSDIQVGLFGPEIINDINEFVYENTNHRIETIIEDLNPDAELVLVNALTFDAEWETKFESDRVHDRDFLLDDGSTITVSMMYNEEYGSYFAGDNEKGFIKKYEGGKYAYVAFRPDDGISMEEYLSTMTADEVYDLINSAYDKVNIGLPSYESDYGTSLAPALKKMGMTDAFIDTAADFTKMVSKGDADVELVIDDVIHKSYIKVDTEGTQAAAATAVIMKDAACCEPEEIKYVTLDRSFVYMIIDCDTNMPVFTGVYNGVEM